MILLLGVGYYLLYGNAAQRKKAYIGLGVAAWLLLLGSISYCLCLPDLVEMNRERRAIFEDPNLTMEQKFEKVRELDSKLTPTQRRQMREIGFKEMSRRRNADVYKFLKMSPEEQVAYLKKQAAEREQRRQQFRRMWGNGGPKGNRGGGPGGGGPGGGNRGGGGPGGGNRGGGGPGGGGPGFFGGGGGGSNAAAISRLDNSSPESRAGGLYQRALSEKLGLGGGGRGGGPGGGGGGGGGRR